LGLNATVLAGCPYRYVAFQMAEVDILLLIAELRPPPDPAPREVFSRHAFEPNSRESCALIKIIRQFPVTLWNVTGRRGF
jgi:hypothetical protein